jgi:hypothetical protein
MLSGFIRNLREVKRGFAEGIAEFIHAWREVQEELGLEPIPEKEFKIVLRVFAIFGLSIAYVFGLVLLARWLAESPVLFFIGAIGTGLLAWRLLRPGRDVRKLHSPRG